MLCHQFGHLVVGRWRKGGPPLRRPPLFGGGPRQDGDLPVVALPIHRAPPRVEVGQDVVIAEDAIAVVAQLGGRDRCLEVLLETVEVAPRQDVRERVDLRHGLRNLPNVASATYPQQVYRLGALGARLDTGWPDGVEDGG